jgi:hypothetical protein
MCVAGSHSRKFVVNGAGVRIPKNAMPRRGYATSVPSCQPSRTQARRVVITRWSL